MKTDDFNHYESPKMRVINVRLEIRLLEGSIEGDLGCSDDDCRQDYE